MSKKFNWNVFSDLLQVVMSFGVLECSSCDHHDELYISVLNRPLNNEKEEDVRGTVHEKHIRLEWTANDMISDYSPCRKRDHEKMLYRLFKGYNMKASFSEPYWTLYLWVPQEETVWKHTIEYSNSKDSSS